MKISIDQITTINHFIDRGIDQFHYQGVPDKEIQILVPAHIITIMSYASRLSGDMALYPTSFAFDYEKFRNVSIAPHYKNEVAIFCKNFYFYDRLSEPIILELPDFKSEENRKRH